MISLVTATLGRVDEVRILLASLQAQTYKDFELILVDQNDHRDLEKLISGFKSINIVYVRSDVKGLSHNRNVGLQYSQGEIIGFPDDDCFYDDNLLKEVVDTFETNDGSLNVVAVSVKGINSEEPFMEGNNILLTRKKLFYKCISYNFFIKRLDNMKFDELLGVGAEYGSGEETDFLWSIVGQNDVCRMINTTFVHHPKNIGAVEPERAYKYGLGFGAIMKKEIIYRQHYSMIPIFLNGLVRALGGIFLKRGKKSYYKSLEGRIKGFLLYQSV